MSKCLVHIERADVLPPLHERKQLMQDPFPTSLAALCSPTFILFQLPPLLSRMHSGSLAELFLTRLLQQKLP